MADIDTIYECTPRQVAEYVEDLFYAGLVPNIMGSPGVGKSSIIRGVMNKLGLHCIDHRASTSDPTDFNGLPNFVDGKARFAPFEEIFPLQDTAVPAGFDGFGIFLDEFNTAPKSIMAAGYKLILDRMVGQHKLHDRTAICMAGNLETDGAITTRMPTTMYSRVVTLVMRTDFDQWLQDVAIPQDYDHRIRAYLNWQKGSLNNFNPDQKGNAFACQRTWESMNKLIKGKPVLNSKIAMYVGAIGAGEAVSFVQFTKVYETLTTMEDVVRSPMSAIVPIEASTRWAVVSKMANDVSKDTLAPVAEYIDRFPIEQRILFYRSMLAQHPELSGHPAGIKAVVALSQYLNPTDRQLGSYAKAA